MYEKLIKRPLDVVLATILAIVTLPVQIVVAILVRLKIGSPVLFRQSRPGREEQGFGMFKFRTMTNEVGPDGELLPDEDRLTSFGKILRKTSLDELPELYNVIKGDMSLVGPRPLLFKYLDRYDERQATRHNVRPGITGLAQVNGRNAISWDDKLELDATYVEQVSFKQDCKILLQTLITVFRHSHTTAVGHATAPEFLGSGGEPVEAHQVPQPRAVDQTQVSQQDRLAKVPHQSDSPNEVLDSTKTSESNRSNVLPNSIGGSS